MNILKNVGNHQLTVAIRKNTMEVNGYRQLSGYQHSLKYLLLCSTEESHTGLD